MAKKKKEQYAHFEILVKHNNPYNKVPAMPLKIRVDNIFDKYGNIEPTAGIEAVMEAFIGQMFNQSIADPTFSYICKN